MPLFSAQVQACPVCRGLRNLVDRLNRKSKPRPSG